MALSRAAFVFLLAASALYSQATSNAGDVKGLVVDQTGSALGRAKLTLLNEERAFSRQLETLPSGEFNFQIVPPGNYRLRVEAIGFTTKILDKVEVRVGDIISLRVELAVSAIQQEVLVTAELAAVETERTQQSNTIEQRAINNLPINRRNYLDFAVLSPGVVETTNLVDDTSFRPVQTPGSGLSFGGSNGRGNGFFIDGVENYLHSGGVRPSVSQEAAQEFQLNRNSFSAEFGNASGGVINIITKTGTNTWRGNLFGFLRHRDIQARNYFDPTKSAFTRVQAGATVGGALKQDRTFLFASFERLDRSETSFVPLLQDPAVFTRLTDSQSALLSFLRSTGNPQLIGLANQAQVALTPALNPIVVRQFGGNSGTFPFGEDNTNISLRIDHRSSDSHTFFFRGNGALNKQNNSTFGALDGFNRGRTLSVDDGQLTFGDTYVFNPRWVLETRLMLDYNRLDTIPTDPNGPEINVNGYGFFGRQIFLPFKSVERHIQFLQNVSWLSGKHDVKFGWDINPVRNNILAETFLGGRFTFGEAIPLASVMISASGNPQLPAQIIQLLQAAGQTQLIPAVTAPITALQSYSLGLPVLYQQGFGNPNYIVMTGRGSGYIQDNWKVARGFTVNLGARYELELNNRIVPRDWNNIAPRVGFAWSPNAKTVIRGGYGLYYSMVNAQVPGVAEPLSGAFINQILLTPQNLGITNAITGQPLTSIDVYQTLLRQGVIGNRAIRESDLAQFGVRVGPGFPLSVVFGVDKDFENPWAHQASFEIERQVGSFAFGVGYNFNRAAHLARTLGKNVAYAGQRLPDGRPTFQRIDPRILQLNMFESSANSFYHAAMAQMTKRFSRGFSLNFNYTFSKAMDESTDFNSDYSPNDQLNARAERALSNFHQAHRVVAAAVYESPLRAARGAGFAKNVFGDWNVSPIVMYNSWRPFNVLTGVDLPTGGDSYVNTKRPAHLGRNMGQGPDYVTFDLRLSRKFRYSAKEGRFIEFLAEGFNLLNRTNFRSVNNVVGDVPYATLGNPIVGNRGPASRPLGFTSALNARQFQFGLKIYW